MVDTTFSFKADEETKERLKQLIEDSGISSKDFFSKMISVYEIDKMKNGTPLLVADIDELESLTKRINTIFIHIGERINTLQTEHSTQLCQSQESSNSTIELLQQRIKSLELGSLEDEERIKSFIEDKEQAESRLSSLLSRVSELEETVQDKNLLIGEYKDKLDALTSIVNEYKAASVENQQLKTEITGLSLKVQDYQNQINLLSTKLDDKNNEHAEQLKKQQNNSSIDREKAVLELERKHHKELQEQQEGYSQKIDEYENKFKDLLEQIQGIKIGAQLSKANKAVLSERGKKIGTLKILNRGHMGIRDICGVSAFIF